MQVNSQLFSVISVKNKKLKQVIVAFSVLVAAKSSTDSDVVNSKIISAE
jgi:hypothetical protein